MKIELERWIVVAGVGVSMLALASGEEPAPDLSGARVTVSYAEIKALWEAAQPSPEPEPAKPPVPAVLASAEYRVTPGPARTSIEARFALEVLAEGWTSVPLVGGGVLLESAVVPPGSSVQVVSRAGAYHALASRPGAFEVVLALTAPSPVSEAWPRGTGVLLDPAAATVNRLAIDNSSPAPDLTAAGGLTHETEEHGLATYHIPAGRGGVRLIVDDVLRADGADVPPVESTWTLDTQIVVRSEATRLKYDGRAFASTTGGDAVGLTFTLPQGATNIAVEEAPGMRWHTGSGESGAREVRLDWSERGPLDREFTFRYEMPQSPLSETWQLVAPAPVPAPGAAPAGDAQNRHLFAIVRVDGLDLGGPGVVPGVSSRRLPDWMESALDRADFVTVESTEPPALTANWLPRVQPEAATVSEAEVTTQIAVDGTLLTTATYRLNHEAPFAWEVALPENHQLLSSSVGGEPVSPVARQGEPGVYEFSLRAPGGDADAQSRVTLSYTEKLAPLDPLSGRLSLAAPQTATFVHAVRWSIALPEAFASAGVEGNLRTTQSESPGTVCLQRRLCRGDRPAVELHYVADR